MNKISKFFYVSFFYLFSFAKSLFALEKGFINEFAPEAGCGCKIKPTDSNRQYENIALMGSGSAKFQGMDIIIICSTTPALSDYWENRLGETKKYLLPEKTIVVCVDEDWNNSQGAGNGMGSLYAYQKARTKALEQYGIDIIKKQASGASIAMYHTAGMGKRLAPLTVSEKGIKSAVNLPGLLHSISDDSNDIKLMTLLEATIKQTSLFASSRKGRLSVFWSDQVFIPSKPCQYIPKSHIDIIVKKIPSFNEPLWKEQNLESYGLVLWSESNEARLLDKCSYSTFTEILDKYSKRSPQQVGISMGTFSLSLPMTIALLDEFQQELQNKTVLLDSDPYFWMPLTLDYETYFYAMQSRKVSAEYINSHDERMQAFKKRFEENINQQPMGFFQALDIGSESYWWDYGTVESYYRNTIKMTQTGTEGELMRQFYNIPDPYSKNDSFLQINNSTLIGSSIQNGNIKNSIVIGVSATNLNLENCIMINSEANTCTSQNSLLYKIKDDNSLALAPYHVRADLLLPFANESKAFTSPISSDGKANWKIKIEENPCSWEEAIQQASNPEEQKCY